MWPVGIVPRDTETSRKATRHVSTHHGKALCRPTRKPTVSNPGELAMPINYVEQATSDEPRWVNVRPRWPSPATEASAASWDTARFRVQPRAGRRP